MDELTQEKQLTNWSRIKYFIYSFILFFLSISWIYELQSGTSKDEIWALLMSILFGILGSALLARVFNKTLSEIITRFFRLKAVKTTGDIVKKLLKFVIWIGMFSFVIWLIISIGPLWVIAIILLLILFILANK